MAIGLHPRLFLTPAVLARAKSRVQTNSPFWQAVKARADSTPGSDFELTNCALAWQLTGQTAYADRTIALMQSLTNRDVTAIDRDDGYDARSLLPAMSIGFDWCYSRLSSSQRSAFAAKMVAWAERIWPETGGSLSTHWGGWPSSNYMHGFQMTGLVGIAFTGENANAERLHSQFLARHKAQTMPRMSKEWKSGYPEEGIGYGMSGSYLWMSHYLTGHLTATGDAPTTIMPADWYPSLLRAFIHLTTPSLRRLYPGGDQPRVSTAPISDYSLAAVLSMMDYLPAEEAGMARYWYDQVAPTRDKIAWTNWQPLLWYRDDVPAIDYRQRVGTFYSAPGMGVVSTRSDWTPNAVQVVAVGGPVIENAHQDQTGSFMLWRGDWLAGCQKIWSSDGGLHNAKELNTVTIDDKNQPAKTSCRVLFSQDTPPATQWTADLTQAYPTDLNEWRRDLLFVRPNFLVILDRVNTKNAGAAKRFLLHTKDAPSLGSGTYRATAGGSTLYGTSLLPAGAGITQEHLATGSYRINIKSPGGKGLEHFLQVLEATPSGQAASLVGMTQFSASLVRVSFAQNVVECALDATGAPALRLVGAAPSPPPPAGNQPPVANAGGPYIGTVGVPVQFDGSGSRDPDGTIASYRWTDGAGGISTQASPTIIYTRSGTYPVALTVTDNQGAVAIATTTATITAAPQPPPSTEMRVSVTTTPSPTGIMFDGAVIAGAPLPGGSTITVTARTPDGRTATGIATVEGNTPPPPPPAPSGPIYEEAESAFLAAPMTRRTVTGASGGAAVGTDTRDGGSATFSVSTATAGTYYLWARVIARDGDHDSFFVSWDGGLEDVFDAGEEQWSASWQWVRLNGRGASGTPASVNPRTLNLSVGTHSVRFRGRETGTLLDRIALTTDAAFRPSG